MNSQEDLNNLTPSQLFEKEGVELAKAFLEKKSHKLPKQISRYQIVEELGRGGMGSVYKAYDPQMNQFIALKVILSNAKEQKVVQRFMQEAKAMGQFSHPNVVRIYEIGEDKGNYFITMDYVQGQNLKQYLQNAPLDVRKFSQLMVKIAKAIQYVHENGVIHRDLKPANIMLDKNLQPQVMDFGLAKLNKVDKSLSKTGTLIGTPQYMSPEQARGEEVNSLTDVYALGAIFYEMLAGKPLTQGQTVAEIMFTLLYKEPDLLRKTNSSLSKDLEIICYKAVAIADFSKAIELDSNLAIAYYNRGKVYNGLKAFRKAILDYSKAIELDPVSVRAYNNRGGSYASLQKYNKAIIDLSKAIELGYFEAYATRGSIYHFLKQYQKAYQDCIAFLKQVPNHPLAPQFRAKARFLAHLIKQSK